MSNVLIGIIGVILFIGLALAGALFLGPRFQEATNNSKAAAVTQALQQVSSATNLYSLNTGVPMSTSEHDTLAQTLASSGYLKTVVTNPLNGNPIPIVLKSGSRNPIGPGEYLYTNLGSDATAKAVCISIERTAGNAAAETSMTPITDWQTRVTTNKRLGCLADANATPAVYEAYIPL
jgi:hypothetical protein